MKTKTFLAVVFLVYIGIILLFQNAEMVHNFLVYLGKHWP